MSLFSILEHTARRHPSSGALFRGKRLVCTYAELRERALRLAAGLIATVPAGGRVAIAAKNCPEYVEMLFAIWAAGLVAVPMNAKLHVREMAQILTDSGAALLFASDDLAAALRDLLGELRLETRLIEIASDEFAALHAGEPAKPAVVAAEDLAWLFFTSGTTGRPKGAMLSHRNLTAMTVAHLADFGAVGTEESFIHAAPMSHGSGLYILPYLAGGARQVIPDSAGFDPVEFLDLCAAHPGCSTFFAPTMVHRLRLEAERSGCSARNLRTIVYGGGPMYLEEIRQSLAVLGRVFVQIYGQGESPMTITGLSRADHDLGDEVRGSVGWPRAGVEVAIVSADGVPLPPGQVGEIVCRSDVVMGGYWNNPAASAQALRGGWLWTGDMGALQADGRLVLRDRSKDVVISGGTNIYPREVEDALLTHPGVDEVCVLGQADAEWGEIVVAVIVAKPGVTLETAALDAHCLERIARFKRPRRYVFADSLPKSSYGKVLKRVVAEQIRGSGQT